MAIVLVCISVSTVQHKCAKGSQKRNVDNSKITCKGDKLFKADKKLARGAGVNVGDYLCIGHRDEGKRANSLCSFPMKNSIQHSKRLLEIPKRLYNQTDNEGAAFKDYRPRSKWCTKCKIIEKKRMAEAEQATSKRRQVSLHIR